MAISIVSQFILTVKILIISKVCLKMVFTIRPESRLNREKERNVPWLLFVTLIIGKMMPGKDSYKSYNCRYP